MGDLGMEEKWAVVVGVAEERGNREEEKTEVGNEEEERLLGGVSALDFDTLCSSVAMKSQGKWRILDNEDDHFEVAESGGVLRMWEGEVLGCFEDRRIAIESVCCPCYRFGKNMNRAGLGSCFFQGTIYSILALAAALNGFAFIFTRRHYFLYLGVAFTISLGIYMGFLRTLIRNKFNIKGTDSNLDDCVYHLVCPCCSLSQEARTLEMNNVQGGTWHGRGDTFCVGNVSNGKEAIFKLHPPLPLSMDSSLEIANLGYR